VSHESQVSVVIILTEEYYLVNPKIPAVLSSNSEQLSDSHNYSFEYALWELNRIQNFLGAYSWKPNHYQNEK